MPSGFDSMTVAQVAKKTGATPDAIRYYCRIGLLRPRRDRRSGYKRFAASDIQRLTFIAKAKRLGFTLREIAEIIRKSTTGQTPCPFVRAIVAERLVENDRNLAELASLQTRMKEAAAGWAKMPDGIPDGDAICHLIESFEDQRDVTFAAAAAPSGRKRR